LTLLQGLSFLPTLPCVVPLRGQEDVEPRFVEAREQWNLGHFVGSLEILETLLAEEPGPDLQDNIALLTGELYSVMELSRDGRAVRWSPDGLWAAYESGEGPESLTHVLALEGGRWRERASVRGFGLAFGSGGNQAAYLSVPETAELLEARARLQEGFAGEDRTARMRLRSEMARLEAQHTVLMSLDLATGSGKALDTEGIGVAAAFYGPGDRLFVVGSLPADGGGSNVFRIETDGPPTRITTGSGEKSDPFFAGGGAYLVYGTGRGSFEVLEVDEGTTHVFAGFTPALSADETALGYLQDDEGGFGLVVLGLTPSGIVERYSARLPYPVSTSTSRACSSCPLQSGLSLAPDGAFAVAQAMPREDWELFKVSPSQDGGEGVVQQVTREIQHDLFPHVLADGRVLAMKGEARHRRAHLYDLDTGDVIWLFRNNTVRTVAPEYEWAPGPTGTGILFVAERDGNTVSPERGVYFMDLSRKVGRGELLDRVRRNLASERALRTATEAMYAPVRQEIESVVNRISSTRIFDHEAALFGFGSKNVTQPGNRLAIEYIAGQLRDLGYEPELQWFDARGVQSANVVARIPGTVSPEVVYTVSAHFDSNTRSPGADDNTSATVGLLEMARVLAGHPMPATIEVALFTGEESGLLGSREYVRRAVESGKKLVGALNNDMVGYAEDYRLDNTIRYSNAGIRDLQHGAAMLFSEMVTHDAEYYKSTDAAAYYDAYGDIVGGIGSYPILASPHYHQSSDVLETINHQLVTEVARMSTASVMLMASSPSRLEGLDAVRRGGRVEVSWTPAVERDVVAYRVAFGPPDDPLGTVREVDGASASLPSLDPGWVISVKAVNEKGMAGWDWARLALGG